MVPCRGSQVVGSEWGRHASGAHVITWDNTDLARPHKSLVSATLLAAAIAASMSMSCTDPSINRVTNRSVSRPLGPRLILDQRAAEGNDMQHCLAHRSHPSSASLAVAVQVHVCRPAVEFPPSWAALKEEPHVRHASVLALHIVAESANRPSVPTVTDCNDRRHVECLSRWCVSENACFRGDCSPHLSTPLIAVRSYCWSGASGQCVSCVLPCLALNCINDNAA